VGAVAITLYSKPGCHLCEEVRARLDELQPELGFTIDEVDITRRTDLFERYRYEIPVLLIDGRELARGRISEAELLNVLKGGMGTANREASKNAPYQ
jgi:glutaredoxin